MPEDRRFTISSTSRLSPDDIARRTFATSRRGFEPAEVRSFLEYVSRELSAAAERERELHDALSTAEHRAANP
ncbi:MAG: DivIVA domain-containing protein, partial [Acidimicrobiales bacterium]